MNRGGAETMIMNLYRNIDRSKIQFDFIVHTEDKCAFDDEIYKLGGRIFRVPTYKGTNHLPYLKNWEHFFKKHPEYKIIHGHVRSTASIYLKIAKKYGLITIAHSHSTSSGNGLSAIAKNVLQFPIRHVADYFFACTKTAGEWLFGKKTCQKENFHIFKNAIDAKKFVFNNVVRSRVRKELRIEDKFVIGHVGRFHSSKNHEFLIDIFKNVHKKNDNAILLLVGDGDLQDTIRKRVYNLGLDNNVIFTGVRSDIPELFQAMDMFVFPSLYEGLGIVLIEAQATGLPCVIANTIPKEALITDNVKQFSLTESPKVWTEAILKRMDSYERKSTYAKIKDSGYDIEESHRWLQEFYLGLVEKDETRFCI
ncbi:glycosyltransferase family 1 protein [Terrihalobacillus insolitus]|uniref:glycosyltransferase family 1 protein n=1 Tax=Terrihalobacillus insolitus TaxID=2950438 RepID=UPI0023423DE2|nr:glycosyltransferase family 1 protein [Terrihalobacillus insolitus]MDC3411847.1 glycosyltransferase family 1 protein [Terrihalobacillus insolitus]